MTETYKELEQHILSATGKNTIGVHNKVLQMAADQFDIYTGAKSVVDDEGFVSISRTDRGGATIKKNPAVDVMNEAMDNYLKLMRQFNLTPEQATMFASLGEEQRVQGFSTQLPGE